MTGVDEDGEAVGSGKSALVDFTSLAKVLPIERIYRDLASRGFKQLGALFEDYVASIRLSLASLQLDAADQRRFRKLLEDPYFSVPPDKRTLPPRQLVGWVLDNARHEPVGTAIWEMFEALLTRGYHKDLIGEAHPSFANLIGNLSSDEAALLRTLEQGELTLTYDFKAFPLPGQVFQPAELVGIAPLPELANPDRAAFYLDHLEALGLARASSLRQLPADELKAENLHVRTLTHTLSAYGSAFAKATRKPSDAG